MWTAIPIISTGYCKSGHAWLECQGGILQSTGRKHRQVTVGNLTSPPCNIPCLKWLSSVTSHITYDSFSLTTIYFACRVAIYQFPVCIFSLQKVCILRMANIFLPDVLYNANCLEKPGSTVLSPLCSPPVLHLKLLFHRGTEQKNTVMDAEATAWISLSRNQIQLQFTNLEAWNS